MTDTGATPAEGDAAPTRGVDPTTALDLANDVEPATDAQPADGVQPACASCLRRAWLLERVSGFLEIAHAGKRPLRDALALDDPTLVRALCGVRSPEVLAELEAFDAAGAARAAAAAGLRTTCRHAAAYPGRLRDDRAAPRALHLAGTGDPVLLLGDAGSRPPTVGIVGTRRATAEGLEVAAALGRGLTAAGLVVVSGMALGIDSAAHAGALDAGGRTVAVLAGGPDRPYPRSKAALHRRILAGGLVVGELPPGAAVRRWAFPARNRIIAALSDVLVVVEAAERSGSLITAELALDLGREVLAVPGSVLSWQARGTNALIRDGATLVRGPEDVLEVLGLAPAAAPGPGAAEDPAAGLPAPLAELLERLGGGADTLASLARTPQESAKAAAGLSELVVRGLVTRAPGGRYVRTL